MHCILAWLQGCMHCTLDLMKGWLERLWGPPLIHLLCYGWTSSGKEGAWTALSMKSALCYHPAQMLHLLHTTLAMFIFHLNYGPLIKKSSVSGVRISYAETSQTQAHTSLICVRVILLACSVAFLQGLKSQEFNGMEGTEIGHWGMVGGWRESLPTFDTSSAVLDTSWWDLADDCFSPPC